MLDDLVELVEDVHRYLCWPTARPLSLAGRLAPQGTGRPA
jgi:hypothetical protein